MKIILDPGHELPFDTGAVYRDLVEAHLTRRIAEFCANDLVKNELEVVLVPNLGRSLWEKNLIRKIKWVNKNTDDGDLLISVHCNSSESNASGVEVWGYEGLPCMRFYSSVLDGVVKET